MPLKAKRQQRRRTKDQVKAMSEAQLQGFLEAAVEDARHVAFLTMALAGIRIGEGLGLQFADADPDRRELIVRRNLAAAEKGLSLDDQPDAPKSGEERVVEIGDELAAALRHHLARRREDNLKHGRSEVSAPWLFATTEGTPLDETRVRKAFKASRKRAGLPTRFTPRCLRHTYATLMLAKGAPLTWVSAQLGHSSSQVTLDWVLVGDARRDAPARQPARHSESEAGGECRGKGRSVGDHW